MLFYQFSLEAEQAILCCLLFDQSSFDIIFSRISERFFFNKHHKLLFKIIIILKKKYEKLDLIFIFEYLKKYNYQKSSEILFYLVTVIKYSINFSNLIIYLNIILEKYFLRCLKSLSNHIKQLVFNYNENSIINLVVEIEKKISFLVNSFNSMYCFSMKSVIQIASVFLSKIKNDFFLEYINKDKFFFGFFDLDRITYGLNKTDVIVVAGRPSIGKTSFVINILENILFNFHNSLLSILFFSMEMSAIQVIERLVSLRSGIFLQKIKSGFLTKNEMKLVKNEIFNISSKNFFIDDSNVITPYTIRSKIQELIKKNKKPNLIIIDYLQLMFSDFIYSNRSIEIAEISRSIKILAKEFSLPIIILSQLNRNFELRSDKNPLLSDLRDSGAIEQDADIILFLNKNFLLSKKYSLNIKFIDFSIIDVFVVKHRNGPTGFFSLFFFQKCLKFINYI